MATFIFSRSTLSPNSFNPGLDGQDDAEDGNGWGYKS